MDRRSVLTGLGAAGSFSLLTGFNFNWRRMLPPRDRNILAGGPVKVPPEFVAIHIHRWPYKWRPEDRISPAPTYRYGAVRSHNYDGIAWRDIQFDRNDFDWRHLDKWVEYHAKAGKTLMYTLYGTPTRFSTRPQQLDPYYNPGGDSKPESLDVVTEFVGALVRRYNGDGRQRIRYLEIWNEPDFHGGRYWRDSAADLAALCRAAYQAAKAADPGIQVLSPPFNDLFEGPKEFRKIVDWSNASDGAGGRGGQWADALAFHYYHYWDDNPVELLDLIEGMRMTRDAIGKPNADLFLTEAGDNKNWTDTSPSFEVKARTLKRWLLLGAAGGLKMVALYSHELNHLGNPAQNPPIAKAIDEMYALLAGATITAGTLYKDGRVEVTFAGGRKVVV